MAHLALRRVEKVYPTHPPLHALRQVDLDIERGEFVAVVGPSGSGKTTLLSLMGLLDVPTMGEVWIDGINTAKLSEARRSRLRSDQIGFVFQQFFLLPALTALENVATGMLYQGMKPAVRRRKAREALDLVGLANRATHRPGELSGGEQQRVAIARAIAGDPVILFADEPTGALDQASGRMVMDCLRGVHRAGATVVVITHDQGLAAQFHRQIHMLDGAVVQDDRVGPGDITPPVGLPVVTMATAPVIPVTSVMPVPPVTPVEPAEPVLEPEPEPQVEVEVLPEPAAPEPEPGPGPEPAAVQTVVAEPVVAEPAAAQTEVVQPVALDTAVVEPVAPEPAPEPEPEPVPAPVPVTAVPAPAAPSPVAARPLPRPRIPWTPPPAPGSRTAPAEPGSLLDSLAARLSFLRASEDEEANQ
ncbi:MAG: ABC transporter ATP-binding protein [Bifidobacteriaceae bacterium]|jgi:putative ABC transport system ATP-binding protein|nr:ABC transporter ATP-binding protein [Bifidobacteriaceae bacterium]